MNFEKVPFNLADVSLTMNLTFSVTIAQSLSLGTKSFHCATACNQRNVDDHDTPFRTCNAYFFQNMTTCNMGYLEPNYVYQNKCDQGICENHGVLYFHGFQ